MLSRILVLMGLLLFVGPLPLAPAQPSIPVPALAPDSEPLAWGLPGNEPVELASVQLARHEAALETPPQLAKPITQVQLEVGASPGLKPKDRAVEDGVFAAATSASLHRTWPLVTRTWKASATRHRPLYFEEVNAERYGYTCSRLLQPAISTAHFFGTVPYLPYLMAADCPCECVYTLGHYRPGSCPPYRKHSWPVSLLGAGAEAAVVVGMIALIP